MILEQKSLLPSSFEVSRPKLVAATVWYQTYYDVWMGGELAHQVKKLHKKYGPIVRVEPNELHFSEPEVYHEIYSSNSRMIKDEFMYQCFGEGDSTFGFIDPNLSRRRREVLSPLFSRRNIISLQRLVIEKVEKLCEKLTEYHDTSDAAGISSTFRCTTMDIITSFCFAESLNSLDYKGFRHLVLVGVKVALPMYWVFKHFRPVQWIFMHTPTWLSLLTSPETAGIMGVQNSVSDHLDRFLANPKSPAIADHVIYHRLLDPENKRAGESLPTRHGLFDETMALLIAGSDTVGNTLVVGGFHVLNNPSVYEKLFNELKKNWPVLEKSLGYEELEKLPYLNAVIKESLRVSHGVVSALPRVVPPSGATIGGAHILGGTVVGMSSPYVHTNEGIFPDAHRFIPERWLQPNSKHLEHWLVPFSRGPRMCLGVNLAWCELTIGFAHIFRKFDLRLHETTERDIRWKEYFVPHFTGKRVQSFIKLRPS